MRVTIGGRARVSEEVRVHAEAKLGRLERHGKLIEVSLILDRDPKRVLAHAELITHIARVRLAAKASGENLIQAIDLVVDKADEQIRRHNDKMSEHKPRHEVATSSRS